VWCGRIKTWPFEVEQLNQVSPGGAFRTIAFWAFLPFFHSFEGFKGTLWPAAATAFGVVFNPKPLDSAFIGALVNKYAVTMLLHHRLSLNAYDAAMRPEQFGSLRFVMAGRELA